MVERPAYRRALVGSRFDASEAMFRPDLVPPRKHLTSISDPPHRFSKFLVNVAAPRPRVVRRRTRRSGNCQSFVPSFWPSISFVTSVSRSRSRGHVLSGRAGHARLPSITVSAAANVCGVGSLGHCLYAAWPQSMICAIQTASSGSNRTRYGAHPFSRRAMATSTGGAVSAAERPVGDRPRYVSTRTGYRRLAMMRKHETLRRMLIITHAHCRKKTRRQSRLMGVMWHQVRLHPGPAIARWPVTDVSFRHQSDHSWAPRVRTPRVRDPRVPARWPRCRPDRQ